MHHFVAPPDPAAVALRVNVTLAERIVKLAGCCRQLKVISPPPQSAVQMACGWPVSGLTGSLWLAWQHHIHVSTAYVNPEMKAPEVRLACPSLGTVSE
jgi:hypothetical protein